MSFSLRRSLFPGSNKTTRTLLVLSLARVGTKAHQAPALKSLLEIDYSKLDRQGRFDLLRARDPENPLYEN